MLTIRTEARDGGWVCEVAVDRGGETSSHTVSVAPPTWSGGVEAMTPRGGGPGVPKL